MASKSTGTSKKTTSRKPTGPIPIDSGHGASTSEALHHTAANRPYNGSGLEEEIRRRAYDLFVERGGRHGGHDEDWMRAEAEILAKYHREKSA